MPAMKSLQNQSLSFLACVLVTQSCPTLCDPMDYSPPVSSVHPGILQARILKWVSTSSSRGSSRPRDWTQLSCSAGSFCTIWATREAPFFGLFLFPHALKLGTSGGQLNILNFDICHPILMPFFPLQFGKPLFNSPVSMGKEVPYTWISTVHLCKSELTVTVSGREGGGRRI